MSTSAYLHVSWAASDVFVACKHMRVHAKRADGQTACCLTAQQVLAHAKRSCITARADPPAPLGSIYLITHSFVKDDDRQLRPVRLQLRWIQSGAVWNQTAPAFES